MKKSVAILIFDDVEVLDFAGPFEHTDRHRRDLLDSRAPSSGDLIESLLQQAFLFAFVIHVSLPLFLRDRILLSPVDELLLPLSDRLKLPRHLIKFLCYVTRR